MNKQISLKPATGAARLFYPVAGFLLLMIVLYIVQVTVLIVCAAGMEGSL